MADSEEGPPDRNYYMKLLVVTCGVGILSPWNFFINAFGYFIHHKFSGEYIGFAFPYNKIFMQCLTFCSQIPAVLFNYFNLFLKPELLTRRIQVCIFIQIIVFLITIILVILDTSSYPYIFFYITLLSVIVINAANGVWQNSNFGIVAKLPPQYTGLVLLGHNLNGTLTSIISIVTKFYSSLRTAAIYYFLSAVFILTFCFYLYLALPLNRYYRYYDEKSTNARNRENLGGHNTMNPAVLKLILKQIYPQLINVFLTLMTTLVCFPSLISHIQRIEEDFFIPDKFYVDTIGFLTFNLSTTFGNLLSNCTVWPGPQRLWILVVLRMFCIPFFLFCNYVIPSKVRALPVLVKRDGIYWFVVCLFSSLQGYIGAVAMMFVTSSVEPQYASTAAMFGGATVTSGIFVGILISFIWPIILMRE